MKTIIAGTNFTSSSFNACKYAALLAQKLNCKLTLFNMFESPIIHSNVGLYGFSYDFKRRSSQAKMQKLISELHKLFPKITIDSFTTTLDFKQELGTFTRSHRVQAAVMGLEAKTKIAKFIFGSHGVSIAGKIETPVIIVPETYKKHKLSKILLAVDNLEKLHKSSLTGFAQFVKDTKTGLDILHLRTENGFFDIGENAIKINGKKLTIHVAAGKTIELGIKRYSIAKKTDLVSIISKKHSAFYNFFSETNTKKIAYSSKIPVMAIHE